MLKSQDTMGNKKCRLLLFQPLKMILNARETCQLVHQLPLLASAPVATGVIKGCATEMQLRGASFSHRHSSSQALESRFIDNCPLGTYCFVISEEGNCKEMNCRL